MLFAAAGASDYRPGKFLSIVTVGRGARYSAIAIVADLYGRHFVRVLSHPGQHWGWLLLFLIVIVGLILGGILANRQLATAAAE
jgi:membrane protein DedA with SNARE-associated domain